LGKTLIDYGYFQSDIPQAVKLEKVDDEYKLLIYVQKDWWDDPDIVESLKSLQYNLSNSVMSLPLKIVMFEESFTGIEEKQLP
jgi:hypothetical protein